MAYDSTDKPAGKETILEKAKRCFKLACEAESKQREREQEDLRFQVPDLQWDEKAKAQRMGGTYGSQVVPPRPILSISKLDQPIQLILNQARAAKLGVNIHPVSEDADDDTAEVMQGIYHRIERDSNADQARLWALDRATKAGRGAYRINTKYDEDAPDTFDQEIVIERILHQDAVYFDPSAQKPDFSDGEWAFVTAWLPLEVFKRKYPKAKAFTETDEFDWHGLTTDAPQWVRGDGEDKAVLVAEYWYKKHETEVFKVGDQEREKDTVTVHCCTITGAEILKEQEWNGRYIPLIPVVGRELQPFGTERRWVGMIGPSRDGQRLYNFAASTLVERMAMEPKTPWVGAEGQFEGHEAEWDQSNVRNLTRLEYKLTGLGDNLAPPPQRAQLDQTGMSLAMMALQEADNFIQSTTSVYDPSLGKATKQDESGRKILALQQQSDAGTSHFLASLADVSMPLEARIVLDLMPAIYDRPGRVTKILGGEDEVKTVMLNQPFVMDPNGKKPVPAQPGQPNAKMYDMRKGTYGIAVNIGKSFQTRLQQGGEMIGEILAAKPELMPLIGPTFFQFQDFPGAKEIADILKKVRDQQMPFLSEEEGQQPTAEQLQAQLQAMQAKGQEMQQQLQLAIEQIKTDQAKQQATIEKARMDNEAKVALARLDAQTEASQEQTKVMLQRMEEQFQAIQAALDRDHEERMQREKLAHEVGMASAGGTTRTFKREDGSESGQESSEESGREGSLESGTEAQSQPEETGGEA